MQLLVDARYVIECTGLQNLVCHSYLIPNRVLLSFRPRAQTATRNILQLFCVAWYFWCSVCFCCCCFSVLTCPTPLSAFFCYSMAPNRTIVFLFFVSRPIHFLRRQVREKTSPNKNSLFLLLYFNVAFYGIFLQLFSIAISTHAMPLYYMLEAKKKENEYRKCSVCCVSGSIWLSHRLTAMMLSLLE